MYCFGIESNELPITTLVTNEIAELRFLIDSGASANFIHPRTVKQYKLPKIMLQKAHKVETVEGKTSTFKICHKVHIHQKIGDKVFHLRFYIKPIGERDAIVGTPWLWLCNPNINWKTHDVTFGNLMSTSELGDNKWEECQITEMACVSQILKEESNRSGSRAITAQRVP